MIVFRQPKTTIFFIITLFFFIGLNLLPNIFYTIYQKMLFPLIRWIYDYTLGWNLIPMIYIVFGLILWIVIRKLKNLKYWKTEVKYKFFYQNIFYSLVKTSFIVISLFYWLWGFHYHQAGIAKDLGLTPIAVDSNYLLTEVAYITEIVNQSRLKLSRDTVPLKINLSDLDLENKIRISQEKLLKSWHWPVAGRVRIRSIQPDGLLLRFSTAGIYIPFVFEGHIDNGLHPIQHPFTIAHEMGHGYGVTDEGECNFIALLTCLNTENDYIQYSALLSYWRYLMYDLRKQLPEQSKLVYQSLFPGIKEDLKAIIAQSNKYPDLMPKLRDLIYDQYLRSHGVKAGLSSYNQVVSQMASWKTSEHNKELYAKWYKK